MFRRRLHPVINVWVKKHRSLEEAEAAQADLVGDLQHEDNIASAEEDFAGY